MENGKMMSSELIKEKWLPFEPFEFVRTEFVFLGLGEADYRRRLEKQLENNLFTKVSKEKKIDIINQQFKLVVDDESNRFIKAFLIEHIDKVINLTDFSWVCIGIELDERNEKVSFINQAYPLLGEISPSTRERAVGICHNQFKNLPTDVKLEWMLRNMDFIPFRVYTENIVSWNGYDMSYRFSHIQKNEEVMRELKNYLSNTEDAPDPDAYYFIVRDDDAFENVYLVKDRFDA